MMPESGTGQPGPLPDAEQLRLTRYVQLAAVAIIVGGCYLVLHPFIPAILFAAVVCSATWPLYVRFRKALWGHPTLAALAMTVLVTMLVIGPTMLLAASLADDVAAMAETAKAMLSAGLMKPPAWVREIPLVGQLVENYWQRVASSGDSLATLSTGLLGPVRNFLMAAGKATWEGLLHLTLASFIGFFMYRDGDQYLLALRKALAQIAGGRGDEFLKIVNDSVSGAVTGIFGTALAQALVAMAGFVIAGVPGAFMLSVAVFFLSIVPIGPPLVWGGATVWLAYQGQTGWAVFMALWGVLGISAIDNLVKPYLISRSSNLPLLLIVLGMLGGVVAFGFIGVFIGPPVLAIGLALLQLWVARRSEKSLVLPVGVAGPKDPN